MCGKHIRALPSDEISVFTKALESVLREISLLGARDKRMLLDMAKNYIDAKDRITADDFIEGDDNVRDFGF